MNLVRLISVPYARKHRLRTVLTGCGIVLGVAVFVGMHTANQSVMHAFNETVDRIAGKTQLQVSAGDVGFDEEILERIQAVPEVRVAAPVIEAVANTGLKGQGHLLILGVDMTGDSSLRSYDIQGKDEDAIDDPLVFLAQPDSLLITKEFADRNGLHIDSRVPMDTMAGPRQFVVRGIMKSGGLTQAFGGNIAVMDIYAAEMVFGRGRHFDRVDIGLREGVAVDQGRRAIEAALGPAFTVETPSGRGQNFEALMSVYKVGVNASSLFALFIGMFIIYNSFSISVRQRRSEIGVLRALGATRAQVRNLFLFESALSGLLGSALGVVLGLLAARGLAAYTSNLMFTVYGLASEAGTANIEPWLLAAAFAAGVVTSTIAGWLPARDAARIDPVQALQKGKYQVLSAGENRIRRWTAAAVSIIAVWSLFRGEGTVFYVGYLFLILATVLLMPTLSGALARLLRAPLRWVLPVEGALAADSLIQAPRRTSATVAALALSLSMAIGMAGIARASFEAIEDWMRTTLNPDLFISTSENITTRTFHFPGSMEKEVEAIPGIAEVQPVRFIRIPIGGNPVMLVAVATEKVSNRLRGRHVVAGDYDEMHKLAAQGRGVIASDNFCRLQNHKLGDVMEFVTPAGPLRMPIVGIISDYSNQLGTLFIDRSVYIRYWKDDTLDVIRVYVKPGVQPSEVRRAILEKFEKHRRIFVLSNSDLKKFIQDVTNQWFGMTYVQIFIAVLVAMLGIVNTLTVSISDRRRELGVLRALGGLRTQIRHTIWMEALTIGIIGLIIGSALGALTLYYEIGLTSRAIVGMPLDYAYPYTIVAALIPIILAVAFAAAIWPGESAVRSSLVEALEYE